MQRFCTRRDKMLSRQGTEVSASEEYQDKAGTSKVGKNSKNNRAGPCKTPSQGSPAGTSYTPLLSKICDIVPLTELRLHHAVAEVRLHNVLATVYC